MKQLTEEQFDERDNILEQYSFNPVSDDKWFGGIRYFEKLPASVLRDLINKGYADPNDCQNSAPSTEEFCKFCEEHPEFLMHGYYVTRDRSDARISVEGVFTNKLNTDMEDLLIFRFADDFTLSTKDHAFYCWYD